MSIDFFYLCLATLFGFFMACGIGANDVANAMGTSVGSRAVSLRQAIIIAMVFEFLGALLAGGEVTQTLRHGLLDAEIFSHTPYLLVEGMLASLLATGLWLALASHFGWPVSTTHTIVGAILGFGLLTVGMHAIQWSAVGYILLAWLLSPFMGGILAWTLYLSVRYFILNSENPTRRALYGIPIYIFISTELVFLLILRVGLRHFNLFFTWDISVFIASMGAFLSAFFSFYYLKKLFFKERSSSLSIYQQVERLFGFLMIFTGCAMAFAHGSNDVANAIGPLAAIAGIVESKGLIIEQTPMPSWVLWVGAIGIVTGLLTYGHRVIATIGEGITQLTPTRGFSATLGAALSVIAASFIGLPVSTTHILVGAVLGVGLAGGISALNMSVIRTIFLSWIVTIPAGALMTFLIFQILHAFSASW